MPFHVEISSPVDRARVLNIDEATLRREILEPWVAGLPFEFGGRDWEPRESRLTILEGSVPERDPASDSGWTDALRATDDVTRSMLEAAEASAPAQIAVVVEADSVDAALKDTQTGKLPQQIPWAAAIERLSSGDPDVTAVILVVKRRGIEWPQL